MDRKIVQNIDKAIMFSLDIETKIKGANAHFNVIDKKDYKDFLIFCDSLSNNTYIDALGGTESKDGLRRYRVDKSLEDVIQYASKGLLCGLKTYHFPFCRIEEWEEWKDGYIEIFIRMDGNSEHSEYFIWMYIEMKEFQVILKKYKNKLSYYE